MNIHKRFIVQFFIQLILAFVLLSLILITIWGIIGFSTIQSDVEKDLSNADNLFFVNRISIKDEKVIFDDHLKTLIKDQDGHLFVLTKTGDVIDSYNATLHESADLHKNELTSLFLENPENYSYWELDEGNSQSYFLLFHKRNASEEVLAAIKSELNLENHHLSLSDMSIQKIEEENGWVQLVDSTGKVVDEYGAQEQPNHYGLQDLILLSQDQQRPTATYYDQGTGQSIIVGVDDVDSQANLEKSLYKTINHSLFIIFILLFLLLLLGTFWYARRFGVPLIMMMKWIKNLGDGVYEQPHDHHQYPVLLNKKGKLKRKYRLYKDFITTLVQLTETLKQNESERSQMTQTREEWITGISHDLKTPLASVTGYSQMLESEAYSWSEAETREFAKVISEKSIYMMELLEDLTLTYRLRNQALPIVKEAIDLNEFIRRTIIHFINDPANNKMTFNFHPYHETVRVSIDIKWFQRIVDNLIANAIKHNPFGTTITVSISMIEQHLVIIKIEDDGIGMNSETLDKLFQRYYRGTNTNDNGSGTGLGLAITKQLVQLHNGSIQVTSTPNKGTTIRIILPINDEDPERNKHKIGT
jgi:signal transduction histidine kinase